ncbi:hypothetical protein SFUMM280S_02807 [Streptomyces fumanus]
MLPIDAAAHGSRWRHRHPVDKAVLGLGLTLLAISLPAWPGAALVLLAALTVLLGPAGVPGRKLWRAARVPLGFCVTGALPLLVRVGGPGGGVGLADGGAVRAGELLLRSWAALGIGVASRRASVVPPRISTCTVVRVPSHGCPEPTGGPGCGLRGGGPRQQIL